MVFAGFSSPPSTINHLATVPLAASSTAVGSDAITGNWAVGAAVLADEVQSEKTAGEPEHSRQEGEGNVGLPLVTGALLGDAGPVEGGAAVEWADELLVVRDALKIWWKGVGMGTYVDEEAESNNPGHEEEEINWPVDESGREWEEPQQRKEDGEAGDDLGVDHALLLALADGVAALLKILASDACDNCSEGQLKLKLVDVVVQQMMSGCDACGGEVGK